MAEKKDSDYRLYLEEKFSGLASHMNAQFINVNDTLLVIKDQTTRTNSRVNHLEDDLKGLEEKADKAIAHGNHIIDTRVTDCPNIERFKSCESKIEEINNKFEDAMFFVRHPKLFIGVIVVFVILTLASVYENASLKALFKKSSETEVANTPSK